MLVNQLIEKEMKEQNEQQSAKFGEIKRRTTAIRRRYEQQKKDGIAFNPETYGQGWFFKNSTRFCTLVFHLSQLLPSCSFAILNHWRECKCMPRRVCERLSL